MSSKSDFNAFVNESSVHQFLFSFVIALELALWIIFDIKDNIRILKERFWFVPEYVLIIFWIVSISCIVDRRLIIVLMLEIADMLVIFVYEIVADEIRARKHRSDVAPLPSVTRVRSLLAETFVLRSSNNGFFSEQFYAATICDHDLRDDPFWPGHASTFYCIEIRRRSTIWRSIIVWQVSLLNGGQRKAHVFNHFWGWTDGHLFTRRYETQFLECFQSRGVVFVLFRDINKLLHVYDSRYQKAATYDFNLPLPHIFNAYVLSISCLGRKVNVEGKIVGWRIRMITATRTFSQFHQGNRSCLRNQIYELEEKCRLVADQEVVFNQHFGNNLVRTTNFIRTSRGDVGVRGKTVGTENLHLMLCNESNGNYVYYSDHRNLPQSDKRIAFTHALTPVGYICPVFVNDREAIICTESGIVTRLQLGPPTMKYQSAKAVFRSNPDLRTRMNADQFREETGVGEMKGHFG